MDTHRAERDVLPENALILDDRSAVHHDSALVGDDDTATDANCHWQFNAVMVADVPEQGEVHAREDTS
jgi:hypothetical protein